MHDRESNCIVHVTRSQQLPKSTARISTSGSGRTGSCFPIVGPMLGLGHLRSIIAMFPVLQDLWVKLLALLSHHIAAIALVRLIWEVTFDAHAKTRSTMHE